MTSRRDSSHGAGLLPRDVISLLRLVLAVACASLTAAGPAIAQRYPVKAIRLVVPYPPGGGTDLVASTPQQFADFLRAEIQKWAAVIQQEKVRPETL